MKKINISFFILLILLLQVIITDSLIYFFNMQYGIANIVTIVINIGLIVFLKKKEYIKLENNFNKLDIVFLVLILIVMFLTISFPDKFWDTYSYHMYLQENPFSEKIENDFFPGRTFTSFIGAITDRIFYIFRYFLGFRLGTLPGYLLLIVIFYECKKILKKLLKDKIDEKYISLISILPILNFIILQQIGTYYVDNFSVVMILEFVYIILFETEELLKEKIKLYYLSLVIGIIVCIKLTNIAYVIVPIIYVIVKNIKNIKNMKWYDYILVLAIGIMPLLPYIVNAIVKTGNPIFPWYNHIFKSEYFEAINWTDHRYGPQNILQFLVWPIYIMIYPEKAYETGLTDVPMAIGYILAIIYIIYSIFQKVIRKKPINNQMFLYTMLLLYLYIAWEKFAIGYTRYGGTILILATILMIYIIVYAIKNKKILLAMVLLPTIYLSINLSCYEYFHYGPFGDLTSETQEEISISEKISDNINKIFKDRENEKYDINGIWGVISDDSCVPMLLNVDDRLVCLEYGEKTGETEKSQKIYWDNVLNNDIYVPLYEMKNDKLDYLDEYKFEIIEIDGVLKNVTFLEKDDTIYIVKVKYNENIENGDNDKIFKKLKESYK